jgi:hypothetical protein
MNLLSRFIAIMTSLGFALLIFELVRRKRLKEKYAILWLTAGLAIFILALSEKLLNSLTHALGIQYPINAVLFIGIFFILLINLHFSLVISNLSEQNKKIAQRIALLEAEIRLYKKETH